MKKPFSRDFNLLRTFSRLNSHLEELSAEMIRFFMETTGQARLPVGKCTADQVQFHVQVKRLQRQQQDLLGQATHLQGQIIADLQMTSGTLLQSSRKKSFCF